MTFENRYYLSDEMLKEYINKVICRKIKIIGGITAAVSAIMSVVAGLSTNRFLTFIFIFVLVLEFSTLTLAPILILKQMKDYNKRIHKGEKIETIVEFDESSITIKEGKISVGIDYTQIIKIFELQNSYVMMFGKSSGIIVSQEGFGNSSFLQFKKFIEEKVDADVKTKKR